jgi:glycerophosphoryl diester phosphodiesterase
MPRAYRPRSLILLASLVACVLGTPLEPKGFAVEIIAHRGSSFTAPENTLASIELAWREQTDAVEIDIWLTADGRIALSHDEKLQRTAGHPEKVSQLRLAALQQLDVGSWKGAAWAGERIPSLEAALATIPEGKRMFVEIKAGPEILDEFVRVVKASGKKPAQVVVIAFKFEVAEGVKEKMPELAVYWLRGTSPRKDKKTGKWIDQPDEVLATCRKAGFDGLDLARDSKLTREYVDQMHKLGLKLYVWTVNSPEEARRLVELGVDGITTDRPGWLRGQLGIAN